MKLEEGQNTAVWMTTAKLLSDETDKVFFMLYEKSCRTILENVDDSNYKRYLENILLSLDILKSKIKDKKVLSGLAKIEEDCEALKNNMDQSSKQQSVLGN